MSLWISFLKEGGNITLGLDLLPLFDRSYEVNSYKLLYTPINSYRYISNVALGREVRNTTKPD